MQIGVLLLQLASSVPSEAAWPQYGFDAAHSSDASAGSRITAANVGDLAWAWSAETDGTPSAPVVAHGLVFAAAKGKVYAFKASDGTAVWSHQSCSGVGAAQPALVQGALVVGDAGGDLAAYDPRSGAQIWCDDESGSITSAPAAADGAIFVANGVDLIALDPATGDQRWRFTARNFSPITGTPAVADGIVYATGGGRVIAVDERTGAPVWHRDLGQQGTLSAASVAGGLLYVGGDALVALDALSGVPAWKTALVGVNVSTPALADGRVYVNSEDPQFGLHAFDAGTGAILWTAATGEAELTASNANGVLFDVDENGALVAVEAGSGSILATLTDPEGRPFDAGFGAQVAVDGSAVYASTADAAGANRVDAFRLP